MGTEGNGLTLEGLAHRLETQGHKLEALERENVRMRTENAELQSKVATLEGSGTRRNGPAEARSLVPRRDGEPMSALEGLVSRRSLLTKAGAAAVAAVAAGTLVAPREAKADDTNNTIYADSVFAHVLIARRGDESPAVTGQNFGDAPGVRGENGGTGPAVTGVANGPGGTGVEGTGRYGVWGESNQAGFYGVTGRNTDGVGVRGIGKNGVYGESSTSNFAASVGRNNASNGKGLYGEATQGIGVEGQGKNGVYGRSSTPGFGAVVGRNLAAGIGAYGESNTGTGVQGVGKNGVHGQAGAGGYAGLFQGGKAQLRLVPSGAAGAPSTGSHAKGEIYMDSAGALFVCTAGGTSPTWKKVATTAV